MHGVDGEYTSRDVDADIIHVYIFTGDLVAWIRLVLLGRSFHEICGTRDRRSLYHED